MDLPPVRIVEAAPREELEEIAAKLNARFESLKSEFASLPAVEATPASIEEGKAAWNNITPQFDKLRERYLNQILPEAFAAVKHGARLLCGEERDICGQKQVWDMVHFDVQLLGGIALHRGYIAEMATGEGKTLVATLPVYLNALTGMGVHVVTVNDYLARRDSEWMGMLFQFLGLTVGCIQSMMPSQLRREQYACDITYGTNAEFGFDYLRDNMEYDVAARRQRPLYYAIVDEVDSILIDEARTPLIISGPADDNTELYRAVNDIPPLLTRQAEEKGEGDYWVDEKAHQVYLSEAGHEHLEQILSERGLVQQGESLYAPKNIILMHHLNAALRAHTLFHRDQHYVVQNGEIVIVDEFTGRLMPGRRWSEGLHQAVEAKEGVKIQQENQTMASITFQNFFRMYGKLSGMTGTADTEAYEFQDIYGLETVVVPTHRKMVRIDEQDKVYRTVNEKYRAIIDDVKACYERRQPVLLGTTSIENSELLSSMLTKEGIPHNVLNAKQHDREAQIVLEAGRPGVVTIATNMAGRGTDIVLGGGINKAVDAIRADETLTEEQREAKIAEVKAEWQKLHDIVVEAGGLRIIGSERHESRRIDNQLRGRAGRQGDPGSSCFYLSMEDQLLRIFGGDRMRAIADKLRLEEGEAIESKMLTRMIESAQRKVEGRNYDIRKQLLEFDDVQNDQRHEIYGLRNQILESEDISELVKNLREGLFTDLFRAYVPAETVEEQWDLDGLQTKLAGEFGIVIDFKQLLDSNDQFTDDDLLEALLKQAEAQYVEKEQMVGHEAFTGFARSLLLQILDQLWRQHISALEALRQGIYLRGYAQKQPKQEYKREAFNMFEQLLDQIRETLVRVLMQVQINVKPAEEPAQQPVEEPAPAEATGSALENMPKEELDPALFAHVGRNDPCPCGSGRRFKDCHGRLS